ncbi:RpiR family transcriptional regulator [Pokkaliibacter plantistimulans]|uniref:RpiR family transcriptional regulator n=1 Tax=Proteobacteria bacterium 228 TaxID=2083153 RepID=A0A2S5KPB4_9PROT|nr:MurR/RpiR family transcriptional regulator [Pokkaliibacter plantistimulans]PPC76475.1 RpiR family transcriptional regulator [Pokkaliibacter plantistimulans]
MTPVIPDIISLLKEQRLSMSKADLRLTDLILEDIDRAVHASTTELAEWSGTSTPTVTRFCRKLGFSSLREFKVQLAQARAVGARFLNGQVAAGSHSEIAEQIIRRAQQALEHQLGLLNDDCVQRSVALLQQARRIVAFGSGGGSTIAAQDMQNRLFRLGLMVNAYQDGQMLQMVAATLKKGDVLVAISTTGRYTDLHNACRIAHQYDAQVIAITRPHSPLTEHADIVLAVDIPEEKQFVNQPTPSRYALLAVIDVLASELSLALGAPALENIRRIKHQLIAYRDHDDDSQPLGD